jgi:PAS domain S-box-containing protein
MIPRPEPAAAPGGGPPPPSAHPAFAQEEEGRYRALAQASPDAILEMDEDSVILSVNPAVERMFGYAPHEMVGQPLSILIPPRLREAHRMGVARYLASGRRHIPWTGVELPAVTRSGGEIPVEIGFGEYVRGGRHVFVGYMRDISARKREEARRAAALQVSRVLAESDTLEQAAPRVLEAVGATLGWQTGALWVLEPGDSLLRCVRTWALPGQGGELAAASQATPLARGQGLPGRVWETLGPVWLTDVAEEAGFPRAHAAARAGLHGAMGFPLMLGGDLAGVLEFFSTRREEPDDAVAQAMGAVGREVGQFVRRRQAEAERDRALAAAVLAAHRAEERAEELSQQSEELETQAALLQEAHGELEHSNRELEAARASAEAHADRLRRVFAQAPVAIATLSGPEHVVRTLNPRFVPLLGVADPEAAVGLPIRQVLPALEGQGFFELLDGVYATGEPFVGTETPARMDRDGDGEVEEALFNFVYQPLVDAEGRVEGISVVAVEVTDLVRAREAARDANRAKSAFLATMSHELRTPLNAMIGYAELLEMGVPRPIPEESKEHVERIRLAAQHLLQLIEEILIHSRIEAGREEVHLQEVMLHDVAAEVAAVVEPLAARNGVRYESELPPPPVALVTDPRKLRQILLNLLGNAVKFTEQGCIRFCARVDGEQVVLTVEDTGIGISREDLAHVFEPFWQAETEMHARVGGTGLGLSVTRQLAELLGGRVRAASRVGHGTTFVIHLPLHAPATPAPPAP